MEIRISLLGRLEVRRGEDDVTPPQPKLRQLLALLALNSDTVVRSETIAEELWNAPPSIKLTRTVQTYISQLRILLAGPGVALTHTPRVGYQLKLPETCLDVRAFHDLRDAADEQLRRNSPQEAVSGLLSALDLCRGAALCDVSLGPVLSEHKARVDAARVGVLERYLTTQLELGHAHEVLAQLDRVTKEDTRYDGLYASLMLGMIALGRRSEATELYYGLRKKRLEQTGSEPGPAVREVVRGLFGQDPVPVGSRATPVQLPMDVRDFVGFSRELTLAETALRTNAARVVGIVGSPGGGKTAFCTHLANRVSRRFPDGHLHADLARTSATDALAGFMTALRPDAHVPANTHERIREFRACTRDLAVLVLLDNVREVADVASLRPGSPESAMLLGLPVRLPVERGATVVELPPLDKTDLLELFAAKVGPARVEREPREARALVARCHGVPLAVGSLAAQVRIRPHWSLARLLHRLDAGALTSGFAELVRSVERAMSPLDEVERAGLQALTSQGPRPETLSVHWVATVVGVPPLDAEQLLERLVEVRLADPVASGVRTPEDYRRYRLNPLYQQIARELLTVAAPAALVECG